MKVFSAILIGPLVVTLVRAAPSFDTKDGTKATVTTSKEHTFEGVDSSASADASTRLARDALSKSSSAVNPDGQTQSSAIAVKNDDVHSFPPQDVAQPSQNNDHNNNGPISNEPIGQGPPVPVPNGNPGHIKVQKVAASAEMAGGTAIATASKRDITMQKIQASGDTAISKATDTSNAEKVVQSASSVGGKLALASASSGRVVRQTSDKLQDKVLQVVGSQGDSAVASAKNNKDSTSSVQAVSAKGGKVAVATASSGSTEPQLAHPVVHRDLTSEPKKTLQAVDATGDLAISKAKNVDSGSPEITVQKVSAQGGKAGIAEAVN